MSENPYAPPTADVTDVSIAPEIPSEILAKIKNAWVAGLISAGITLVFTGLAIGGISFSGIFTAWQLLDVALVLGFSYGIYRKSRVCATLLLLHFVSSKVIIFSQTGSAQGVVLAVVFLYYYALGVHGTFVYHKLVKEAAAAQP